MSSKKRVGLDNLFVEPRAEQGVIPSPPSPPSVVMPPVQAAHAKQGSTKRPGYKNFTAYIPNATHQQLRKLAFEEDKPLNSYLLEGLQHVFRVRGLPATDELA